MLYPYMIHRTYLCGHPDEFIEVDQVSPTENNRNHVIQHTFLPPIKPSNQSKFYQQSLERCTLCAREHQARKQSEFPKHPVRKLAAHQGQTHSEESRTKDGFSQVLSRFRLRGTHRERIAWKDDSPEDEVLRRWRNFQKDAGIFPGSPPHAEVPYRARRDKHVVGPQQVGKSSPSTYTIMVNVHEDLIPPRSPTTPPGPLRYSDSALLEDSCGLRRDTVDTSLSSGDQPRDMSQSLFRIKSARGRADQSLPMLRSHRDILKERVSGSPGGGSGASSPRTSRLPRSSNELRLSQSSSNADAARHSNQQSQEGVNQRPDGQQGRRGVSRSSKDSSSHGSYEVGNRGGHGVVISNPYEHSPRRSNEAHSNANDHLIPSFQSSKMGHGSDSDASSVGRW